MRSFRAKITSNFLFLIGFSVLTTGIFVAFLLRSSYLESIEQRLYREGKLIADVIEWNEQNLQKEAILYGEKLKADVIFLNNKYEIIGSYGVEPNKQIAQLKTEIDKAFKNQTVSSINNEELYSVVPIVRNHQVVGVLQLSIQLDAIVDSLNKLWVILIGGLIIAFIIAAIAGSRIARGVTQPLEKITRVADDISKKRLQQRVSSMDGSDEVARLGKAINRMAHSLQIQLETIRKSEQRLKSVIETMESGLLLINSSGRISLVNKAFEELFGIPAKDILGLSFEEISNPTELRELIQKVMDQRVRIRKDIQLYYPEERVLEASFAPMWGDAQNVGVVAIFHDLTAVRRLEEMRRDFVANVSHELKTPITSIRGFAETLLDGAMQDEDTLREFLQIIHNESINLQALVSDLLDLSQIESKRIPMKLEKCQPKKIVESVMRTLEERLTYKRLKVQKELQSFSADVAPDRFRQVVLNLVSNAMTYTPAGGKVFVRLKKDDRNFFLVVEDTGIGIPESDLPRVFERFYRVDKARSRNSGGTGLGLAIVKHIVEEHQGDIEVDSKVGEGTTFTIRFPLEAEPSLPGNN